MLYRALTAILAIVLGFVCFTPVSAGSIKIGTGHDDADFVVSSGVVSAAKSRQTLDHIGISGFSSSVSSGNPALPCKVIYVALPPDADIGSIRVETESNSTQILAGEYDISPVPAAATADGITDWGQDKNVSNGRNALVYGSDKFYPEDHLRVSLVGQMRTWKVAAIEYWPYCYNPSSGKLRTLAADNVSITYDTTQQSSAESVDDPTAVDMSDYISNKDQAETWYTTASQVSASYSSSSTSPECYAIITTKAIASASSAIGDFVDYQTLRGFNVKIFTESDWGGGSGNAAAENIRSWLKNNYLKLNIEYVLFIGNPNPGNGDVPMKMLFPRNSEKEYKEAPSDYYFADLTGNWDLDQDGYFGEESGDFGTGGIDLFPEVYVGRIPFYGNISELDHILRKTIEYGSTPSSEWRHNCLLPMKPLEEHTLSYQLGEQIKKNITDKLSLKTTRIYDSSYDASPPPEVTPCAYSKVEDEWAKGAGLVFWMTHGSTNLASEIMSSKSCSALDDSRPSIVYAGSCYNGYPEDPNNLGYTMLLDGAVATVSASRVSWFFLGENIFTSSDSIGGVGYQYAKYLLSQNNSCAHALMNSHLAVPTTIWANDLVFNLYGDPSIVFGSIAPGGISGKVTSSDGAPLENALIKFVNGNESTSSAQDGKYIFAGLSACTKDIQVSAQGFYTRHFYNVPITPGRFTHLDACLNKAVCGSISGCVHDANGSPIADALVKTGNGESISYTANDGSFRMDNLAAGSYFISAYKYPFAEKDIYDIKVTGNTCSKVDIALNAQHANVLINGGFESGYTSCNSGTLGNYWQFYESSGYSAYPVIVNSYRKYDTYSQRITLLKPQSEGHAGIYQVADVMPGASYLLAAWVRSHFSGDQNDPSSNVVCRLGYDPTGGTNPTSPSIIWTTFISDYDYWYNLFETIIPYSQMVTVFLDAWRKQPSEGESNVYFDGVVLRGPARSPSVPAVWVSQYDKSSISANWSSPDLNVLSYEYAVSTTADEGGIVSGGEWKDVGVSTSAQRTGLDLQNGQSIRVLVKEKNNYELSGEIGASEPVKIITDVSSVASARQMADGLLIRINDLQVTRMGFGSECYVEDKNRVAGIKLKNIGIEIPYLQPGTLVSVIGTLSTENGMRVITDAQVFPSIVGTPLKAFGMLNKSIGSNSIGLSSCGLLVTAWGKVGAAVQEVSDSGCFVINDGSTSDGIIIECFNSAVPPVAGAYVRVTGISTPEGIAVYSADDIVLM